jgi:hypothetical protein
MVERLLSCLGGTFTKKQIYKLLGAIINING